MVEQVFHQSKKKLGHHAYPIWKEFLLYKIKRFGAVGECYDLIQKILIEEHEFFGELKAICLEWVFGIGGINGARTFYKRSCVLGKPSLQFHQKIASLEAEQVKPNARTWRQALEQIAIKYGRNRAEVWLEYIRFEQMHGDAHSVQEIAARARSMLSLEQADIFSYELGRFQAKIV